MSCFSCLVGKYMSLLIPSIVEFPKYGTAFPVATWNDNQQR